MQVPEYYHHTSEVKQNPPSKLMECNRDEAIRAKTIAEKKFADKDYTGAKKFTLKAQTLNPLLDGISQMLITLDVYIASETKVNGESDWYKVLNVKPPDDDETVKKQYRKLLLILHPDKNKSVGADGAFKIVSEAWSLLSVKAKRLAFNQRRNPYQSRRSLPGVNGVHHNHAYGATSRPKSQNSGKSSQRRSKLDSFWTICHRCRIHYEYLKVYLNHTLLCPNCHKTFHAVEMAPPINIPFPSAYQRNRNSGNGGVCNSARREHEDLFGQRPLKRRKEEGGGSSSNVKVSYQTTTRNYNGGR